MQQRPVFADSTISEHSGQIFRPPSLSRSLRVVLSNNLMSNAFSSRVMERLTADGVLPNCRAAPEKLPTSTTLAKTAISSSKAIALFVLTVQRSFEVKTDYRDNMEPIHSIFSITSTSSRDMPLHITTPLIESNPLSKATGRNVWMKLEAFQEPGSFKIRGVGLACEKHAQAGKRRFISSSGGNAGIAVAYAGQKLGVSVVVVVPTTTGPHAQAAIKSYGAELIIYGNVWDDANALAQSMLTDQDAFIHPFDDELLWHGHASMIDEVAASRFQPDAIVLSVGGGGLFAGVVEGLRRNNWHHIPIITAETAGADALARSIGASQPAVLEKISSVATSLGAKKVCEQAFKLAQEHTVHTEVVSDNSAVKACLSFLDDHRILVEPACGASLALAYQKAEVLNRYENLLFIVCGGTATSFEELQRLHRKLSLKEGGCCINPTLSELPQAPAVAMPRLPSEDGPVL